IATITDHVVLTTHVVATAEASFAMPAGNSRLDHHFITWFNPGHKLANFAHNAGNVTSQNVRQRNLNAGQSISNKDVEMVQRAGFYLNYDFVCTKGRLGHVGVL